MTWLKMLLYSGGHSQWVKVFYTNPDFDSSIQITKLSTIFELKMNKDVLFLCFYGKPEKKNDIKPMLITSTFLFRRNSDGLFSWLNNFYVHNVHFQISD